MAEKSGCEVGYVVERLSRQIEGSQCLIEAIVVGFHIWRLERWQSLQVQRQRLFEKKFSCIACSAWRYKKRG